MSHAHSARHESSKAQRALDFFGANIELADVTAGSRVVVRTHYYPAWRADAGGRHGAHARDDHPLPIDHQACCFSLMM